MEKECVAQGNKAYHVCYADVMLQHFPLEFSMRLAECGLAKADYWACKTRKWRHGKSDNNPE